MKITVMGIDLAKNVFQVHGVDERGKVICRKKLSRGELMKFIANTEPCLIGMEACGSANYWSRKFKEHGHTVKLMAPQYVKPFVKRNKNDSKDAEGICIAVQRPEMHFVSPKSVEQQDVQSIHRIRSRLVAARTALSNELRGLLSEYGIIIPKGIKRLRKVLPEILEDGENCLTVIMREAILELQREFLELDSRIEKMDEKIQVVYRNSEVCQRIGKIEGVGVLTATAIVAAVGNAADFKNGRQMSAWLGLVPRQHSSGGKDTLLGISKQGDCYIRTLLIHGGRAVVRYCKDKTDKRSLWVSKKVETRGKNKTAVAVANKNVRIIWKMMVSGESYRVSA